MGGCALGARARAALGGKAALRAACRPWLPFSWRLGLGACWVSPGVAGATAGWELGASRCAEAPGRAPCQSRCLAPLMGAVWVQAGLIKFGNFEKSGHFWRRVVIGGMVGTRTNTQGVCRGAALRVLCVPTVCCVVRIVCVYLCTCAWVWSRARAIYNVCI